MVQKIVTSGNCLQFPESPAKIRENFTEKFTISVDLQPNFEFAGGNSPLKKLFSSSSCISDERDACCVVSKPAPSS